MKRYWKLFWLLRKVSLMKVLEYRANFLFWSLVGLMWSAFNFMFFAIMANVNQGIAGWSAKEMYLLLSIATIFETVLWTFFYHTMHFYTRVIFNGELNMILTKPVDTQAWIMMERNTYNQIFRFIFGCALLIWSLQQLQIVPSLAQIILVVLLMIIGWIFVYFFWFFLSTFAFWVERLENINEIIPNLQRSYQVPRQVYVGLTSVIFTTIVPLGLVSSLPSEVLLGKTSWPTIFYFATFTILLVIVSRLFFKVSIKRYSGMAN